MSNSASTLEQALSTAISQWSVRSGGIMTASEIERATQAAVQAVHNCGPNANSATSPESAYWQSATGPLGN